MNNDIALAEIYEGAADRILLKGLSYGPHGADESKCTVMTLSAVYVEHLVHDACLSIDLYSRPNSRAVNEGFFSLIEWSDYHASQPNGWAHVRDTLLDLAKELRNAAP